MKKWNALHFFLLVAAIHLLFWACVLYRANTAAQPMIPDFQAMIVHARFLYGVFWLLYLGMGVCFALLRRIPIQRMYQLALEGVLVFLPFFFYSICCLLAVFGVYLPGWIYRAYNFSLFLMLATAFTGFELVRLVEAGAGLRRIRSGNGETAS